MQRPADERLTELERELLICLVCRFSERRMAGVFEVTRHHVRRQLEA